MIAELFEPLDIECLVKSAVELWEGAEMTDLSERQQDMLDRARTAMLAEHTGRPLPGALITSLVSTDRPSQADDTCLRCGGVGFLARATEWFGTPALCTDCHETLDTQQARDGHQCLDGCPQPVNHTGLCFA
ncbi:hypothetical protein [Embleya sp. MST-111070]|uniref:hypothetical protein n=1 Tax=Embleya sp. MST-111070 TaxID=3398231 RepID=UPI003F73C2EA